MNWRKKVIKDIKNRKIDIKETKELENIFKNTNVKDLNKTLSENKNIMIESIDNFVEYFNNLLKIKCLKKNVVSFKAGIKNEYGYKLMSGEKITKQRDTIIRLCYAANCNVEETNMALKLYGMAELYAKQIKDAVLISCLNSKNEDRMDIDSVNEILIENGCTPLKTVGWE